jgi:hypothetical protein
MLFLQEPMTTEVKKTRRLVVRKSGVRRSVGKRKSAPRPAAGHLDPGHAARLHRLSRENEVTDADVGFLKGPHSRDDLTERMGEEAVSSMTSGESQLADDWDKPVEEEGGGPFVGTQGSDEFASGTDASNTADATREPFPKTSNSR